MEAVMTSVEVRVQSDHDPLYVSCAASSSSTSAVFRKIEFHSARRTFNGFSNGRADFMIETLNPGSANKRPASATPLRSPDSSDLLETGLDPELSFGITFRKIGAGLENLGNTCFLNSVLQCLTYTEPLAAYLQSAAHQKSCHVAGFCALCAIQKHVRTALHATGRILAPKDLVSNLRCISRSFRNCRQEDAHEYMISLLECMHKCCLPSGVPSESVYAYKSSLVHKIFGGRLRSQVKCTQCSHCSDTFDPFLDLSLDIARADSLQKALSHFTAVELLDDGAKIYQCERCKQKVKAVKQLTVSKAPYVLTVHFKRFEAHRLEKIDKKVQFGPTIDIKPFVSGSHEGDLKYTLYGVLVHYGRSIHSGHYACFIRTSSGMWYSLDDNRVKQVAERTVFEQKAYMLFYVRDRKNALPKNPAGVVRKDSSRESLAANRASPLFPSNLRQDNGSAVMKSCNVDASAAGTQKGKSSLTAKETLLKEAPSLEKNGVVMAKCFLESEVSMGECTASNVSPGEILKPLSPFLNRSTNTLTLRNIPTSGVMFENRVEEKTSEHKLNASVDVSSPGSRLDETSQKVTLPSASIPLNFNKLGEPVDKTSEATDVVSAGNSGKNTGSAKPSEKPGCDNSQVVTATSGNSLNKKAVLNDQKLEQRSEEAATLCDMSAESVKTSTSDSVTRITLRKSQKPHFKNMYAGLKFFKLALGLRKKKKQKRGKLRASAVKNISEELIYQRKAADQDLTSQPASRTSFGSTCSLEKDDSLSAQDTGKSDSNGDLLFDGRVGELRKRINLNGSVLASEKQPFGNSGVSEASQSAKRKRDSSKDEQGNRYEKAAMSILTRGLPETLVAKWDDQELPSQITGSMSDNVSIGYVADEWDEEYDRGKRKKMRKNKVDFGGPNPFQLVASEKRKRSETKEKWRQR